MTQPDAWDMLQRRAKKAGITTQICNVNKLFDLAA